MLFQTVQGEMVESMKEDRSIGGVDLNRFAISLLFPRVTGHKRFYGGSSLFPVSRWLTMAQLVSASFGETSLSMERWQMAKELERLRKERLK